MKNEPSPTYLAALAVANEASRVFRKVSADYRLRLIDDAAFLAARATHAKACDVFDVAMVAELERPIS